MRLSVIIPVYNRAGELQQCLCALAESARHADQVIVVDNASTDDSAPMARGLGARVIALMEPPRGAAAPRNRGAEAADGDVLVFLDADVAVHPETLGQIETLLHERPEVDAVFGSYDAHPSARTLVSLYKNLLHHYTHQHGQREASTFWTGCGAVRSSAFRQVGGFDENQASLEDIELGIRLRRAGHRIYLAPEIQVTHLKRWTFNSLLRSDIRDRAIPWCRLILRERNLPNDLNLDRRNRQGAIAVWMALLCAVVGLWVPWAFLLALVFVALLLLVQANLYRLFAQQGGIVFALGAIALHALYLLYSSLTFVLIVGPTIIRRRVGLSR